ncbi:hypothetical protein CMK22_03695 [Candidatus Poribacteria bacterium]|nr:hypothetical protein [Candidatus Poribacteria bacterium]
MSFSCPELTLDEMLAMAKEFGYDGIEPRISSNHQHGVEFDTNQHQRKEIKQKALDIGIAIGCVATSCRYADPKISQDMVNDTEKAVDLAADIGSSRIRVFGGKIGDGLDRTDAVELVAESLLSIADYASKRGVSICVETHDDWCNPIDVAAVMEKTDHSAIAVNWDIMHPVRRGYATIEESFESLKPWIQHLHIHDGSAQKSLLPIGEGDIDHKSAIERLSTIAFDGYLSGEWISWDDPYRNYLPRELQTLKRYQSEL